jgi:chromate transporter
LLKLTAVALLLWLAPLPYLYFASGDFRFWKTLTLFFTKTAFVTIGGSYTVIPYVAHVAVNKLHWLSQFQMTDGFALAETTPGPLIIVVGFVGFMAAYNHFQHSLWMGTLGLLLTTFYTFLPCFLFVFAGAPLVERTHDKPALKGVLSLITAVVVGAMLDLLFFLGRGVLFPTGKVNLLDVDFVSVGWAIAALVLLMRFRINVVYVILLSIAFGLLRHQFRLV